METKVVYKDEKKRVIEVYLNGKLFYTSIYVYDADGYIDYSVTAFANGYIDVQ